MEDFVNSSYKRLLREDLRTVDIPYFVHVDGVILQDGVRGELLDRDLLKLTKVQRLKPLIAWSD